MINWANWEVTMDIKPYMTWRNAGICAAILAAVLVIMFSIMYSKDVGRKFQDYKQIKSAEYTIGEGIDKLVIMNGVGEVELIRAKGTSTTVNAYLQYVSDTDMNDLKLEEMTSDYKSLPADEKDKNSMNTAVISNTLANGTNYFSYLYDKNIISDVKIKYTIKVPNTVKEVYVYNPIGDVEAYDIDASLDIITAEGNIIIDGVKPDNFILAQTYKGDIDMNIDDTNLMYIGASTPNGKITIYGIEGPYKSSNDIPKFLSMNNDIFKEKTYKKVESKFLSKNKYDYKQKEVGIKAKNGEIAIWQTPYSYE